MAKKKDLLNTKNTKAMQKTKRKTNTIREKRRFYNFCVKIGIDVASFEVANLQIHEIPPRPKSTFKQRASEIKQRFNHVFKTQNPIENYPNIESIKFERV